MTERVRPPAARARDLVRYLAALLAAIYLVAWWAFRLRLPPPAPGPRPAPRRAPVAAQEPAPPIPLRAVPARAGAIRTRSS